MRPLLRRLSHAAPGLPGATFAKPAKRGRKSSRLAAAGLAAIALGAAACSGAPRATIDDGKIAASASALDPNGVISPTTYNFSLTITPGYTVGPGGNNQYIDYAALAVQRNSGEPDVFGCSYGQLNSQTLSECVSGPTTGSPITRSVTITSSTDTVLVGLSLDNIQAITSAVADSALADGLSDEGTILQGLGAVGSTLPFPYDAIGVGLAAVGKVSSLVSSFIDAHLGGSTLSCNGGLIANPPAGASLPSDLVTQVLTAQQLATMTADGPTVMRFFPTIEWNNDQCSSAQTLLLTISRDWTTGSGGAAFAKSSDGAVVQKAYGTDHFSVVTSPVPGIVHESLAPGGSWSTELITANPVPAGTSQEPPPVFRSGSAATVASLSRTSTSLDAFFVDDTGILWWAYSRSPGVWNESPIVPSGTFLQGPPPDGHVTAVSRTPNSFDLFWVGLDGGVHEWSMLDPSVFLSTQPTTTTQYYDLGGGVDQIAYQVPGYYNAVTTTAVSPANVAPAGAGIAAVARTPTNIDLFFAGKDTLNSSQGGIWTSSLSGMTWAPAPNSPPYFGGSWNTYELAYSSGLVAPGANLTAAAQTEANLDVFFAGTDGQIHTSSWQLGGANYVNAPFSNGKPAFATLPLPGTAGLAVSGQPISVVSPEPLRPPTDAAEPETGNLQVAWVGAAGSSARNVYLSSIVNGSWGAGPIAIATPQTVSGGASQTAPISIVAPSSTTLSVAFSPASGGHEVATWNYPAQAFTLTGLLPTWQWQGWDNIQGGLVSDTALTAPNPDDLWVAATAPNGAVWVENYNGWGNWTGWQSLGSKGNALTDGPALVAVNGKLEVFVRDPVTTHLLHQEAICESVNVCNYPTWNTAGWEDLGGTLIAGTPSVVISQPNNQINVFATWTDNAAHFVQGTGYGNIGAVWTRIAVPGGVLDVEQTVWTNLSGGVLSEPAAVSWGPSRIDVIVRGSNDQLYKRYSTDNGATWNPSGGNWQGIGGVAYSTPTIVSWGPSRFDIFAGGIAGQVNHMGYNDGGPFNWDTVPGLTMPVGVRPAAVARGVGRLDVFGQSAASGLFTSTLSGYGTPASAWSSWAELSSCFRKGGTPAVVSPDGAKIDLVMTAYAANGDANVWHNSTSGLFIGQNSQSGNQPPLCQ